MTDEPELKIVKVPMLDTGIGRMAGFVNDEQFISAMRAEREQLAPDEREFLDEMDRKLADEFLNGSSR